MFFCYSRSISVIPQSSNAEIFKDALTIKFTTDAIGILEPADTAPTQPIEPEPTAPTAPSAPVAPDTDPVIDVEVMTATDTPVADEPIEPAVKTAAADIETLLNKMSLADIRKLAKAKGSDARGNRINIAARLKKILTESDIWDATA
jgi:hypothetical protein